MNTNKNLIHTHLYSQDCLARERAADFLCKCNSVSVAKELAAQLANKDRFVAIRAAWGLSLMKEKLSQPSVIKALYDSNPDVRRNAGWALRRMKSSKAEKALAAAFKSRDPEIQKEAAFAMHGKGIANDAKVQEKLIELLSKDNGGVTLTLGGSVTKKALDALASALKDKTFKSKSMAILSLARKKDNRALQPAIKLLKAGSFDTSTAAWALRLLNDSRALGPVVDHVAQLGTGETGNLFNDGMKTIDLLKRTAAAEKLVPLLRSKDYRTRLSGVVSLGALASNTASKSLVEMLGDKHWLVRGSAAEALGAIGDNNALKDLTQSLGDKSWYVRRHAAFALGRLKDSKAVPKLLLTFKDKNELVRVAAAKALNELADPRAIPEMIHGLTDYNPGIRESSADFMGKVKAYKSVPALITRLANEHWHEKVMAAEALGNIGDRRAITPLKKCLKDNSAEVYLAAEKALKQIAETKPTAFPHTLECRIR